MKIKFYNSKEWQNLRYAILREQKGTCQLCGRTKKDGVVLHVDHIIPLSKDWSKRLDKNNLQVLCKDCNLGKSNTDSIDWRDSSNLEENQILKNLTKNSSNEFIYTPNESVLVQNDIINSFFSCSTYQLRLILMAISKTMNDFGKTEKANEVYFSVKEFCDTMGMEIDGRVRKNILGILEKTSQLQIKILATEKKYALENWFEYVVFDEDKNVIKFRFTKTVFDVIKVIGQKFTKLDFSVIGKCSFYAIRWYMFVKESMFLKGKGTNEKNTWTITKSFDEIRNKMNIDENAYRDRNNNFLKYVVKNPIEELNKINMEFQIGTPENLFTKIKKGKTTVGVMLECHSLTNKFKITNDDSYEKRQDKIAINREEDFITKYRKEFNELFELEKTSPSIILPIDNDLFRRARALTTLAKKHPTVAKRFGINTDSEKI